VNISSHSRILIWEYVLPDTGAAAVPALLDIQMMMMVGGKERTEKQWAALLVSVGLEIVKLWGAETRKIIEARLTGIEGGRIRKTAERGLAVLKPRIIVVFSSRGFVTAALPCSFFGNKVFYFQQELRQMQLVKYYAEG
jgi:O-methyltransferase domain